MTATHEVTNQPPPLAGYDASDDPALLDALRREGAAWAEPRLRELGRLAGAEQAQENGRLANDNPPKLRTHDRYGHRVDEVEFHPAWHDLMTTAVGHGLHAAPWRDGQPGAHVARAAGVYVWGQAEAGHLCPVSMTYAIVPALRHAPELAKQFEPLLAAPRYDFGLRPPLTKEGLLAGMSMTEKQGGSDVRANTTTAAPQADGTHRITGHKWFTSAPMGDLFMVLAQTPGTGLSCFLLPRVLPDGTRNGMRLMRLKDKLGNRSNASAEVEYEDATAWLVGDEGRGVRTIIEMVNSTRLDCVLAAATGMRLGVIHAAHHAAYRTVFGRPLKDQPLMANVLADLAVESEAATTVAMRLAGATDRAARGDEHEAAFRRLALAVTKYWVCKQAPGHAAEALECLGGNGYVEESGMPRLYREAPLGSIWEGSGNVAALDALRALTRQPESAEAFFAELELAAGADRRLDDAVTRLRKDAADPSEQAARRLAEAMAVTLQAALLVRHGHPAVADAFAATRLAGDRGHAYGTLPAGVRTSDIIARATALYPERGRRDSDSDHRRLDVVVDPRGGQQAVRAAFVHRDSRLGRQVMAAPADEVVLQGTAHPVIGHHAGLQAEAARSELGGKERTELNGAAVDVVRADGLAEVAVGRERAHDRLGVTGRERGQVAADDVTGAGLVRVEDRRPEVMPAVDRPLAAIRPEYDRPIGRKLGDDRDRPGQVLPVAVQVGEQFDHGPRGDAGRGHRLNVRVALGQPGLVVADELPQLPVPADLSCLGVVDHHLTRPYSLQNVRVALAQRGEVLPDRISLTRGASLYACQRRGVGELRKPRHRDSLALRCCLYPHHYPRHGPDGSPTPGCTR